MFKYTFADQIAVNRYMWHCACMQLGDRNTCTCTLSNWHHIKKKQVAEGETLRIVMCIYSEELIIKW